MSTSYLALEFAIEETDWDTKTKADLGYEWGLFLLVLAALFATFTVVYMHIKKQVLV